MREPSDDDDDDRPTDRRDKVRVWIGSLKRIPRPVRSGLQSEAVKLINKHKGNPLDPGLGMALKSADKEAGNRVSIAVGFLENCLHL